MNGVELLPTTVTEAALSAKYAATSIPINDVPTITTCFWYLKKNCEFSVPPNQR